MINQTTMTETTQVKMQLALKKQFQQWLFNRTSIISLIVLVPTHLCLAKISGLFSFADGSSAIWPSSGVFLAALMLFGPKVWLPIFISDWIVCQTLFYHALPTSLLISTIDAAEAIGASLLMLHFVKRSYPFDRIASTLKYLLLLIPMPLVSSGLAVAVLSLLGISNWSDFWPVYRGWLCGVLAGEVVITPFLLSTWYSFRSRRWQLTDIQLLEFLLVLVLLFVIGLAAFAGTAPIEYVLIFPLMWSAIRFGPRESTFLALAMSVFSIYQTLQGHGSFAQNETAAAAVLLQSFIAALTIATLVLSAAIQENRQANSNLREINGDLENRVERRTEELSETLHQLKRTQAHLVQQEKMSGLGQMVAGVAHEINNPVNFIHGNLRHIGSYTHDLIDFLQLYEKHYPNPHSDIKAQAEEIDIGFIKTDLAKTFTSMKIGTERIREIVLSLRNFSRMDESGYKAVDIHQGIESTLMILQHRLKASPERPEIAIIRDFGELPPVECYASQLNQVFMNILVNGIDALETELAQNPGTEKMPQITLRTEVRAQSVVISIADNGTGIPVAVKDRIFDPFFTTKAIGKGTGMGMAISYQIVTEKHRGKIECFSDAGVGTEFVIEIPICLSAEAC